MVSVHMQVRTFPGESFPLRVQSFDISNLPAAGILQLTLQVLAKYVVAI